MKPGTPALLLLLAASASAAHAQQADGNLNKKQLQGRHLLAQSCGICHLQPARGSVTYGPVLNKASVGGNDVGMRALIANGTERMPGFRHYLKAAEIDAIVAYVRTVPVASALNDQQKGATR